jgi:preprotein translocase subunit YajC
MSFIILVVILFLIGYILLKIESRNKNKKKNLFDKLLKYLTQNETTNN